MKKNFKNKLETNWKQIRETRNLPQVKRGRKPGKMARAASNLKPGEFLAGLSYTDSVALYQALKRYGKDATKRINEESKTYTVYVLEGLKSA